MAKLAFVPPKEVVVKRPPAKKAVAVASKKAAPTGVTKTARAGYTVTAKKGYRGMPSKKSAVSGRSKADAAAFESIRTLAQDLFDVGGIDQKTMREYDALCLPKVPTYDSTTIVKIRQKAKVSQNLFAHYLNTSASTVQKWETGAKKPSGPAAKLLQVIEKHGIKVLG